MAFRYKDALKGGIRHQASGYLASGCLASSNGNLRSPSVSTASPLHLYLLKPPGAQTMPTYTRDVPEDRKGASLPVLRTPMASPLVAVITSADLVGIDTHYFKGRTMPCERPDCEPCRHGVPYRWHAYVAALRTTNHLHFLFECTAGAAEAFIAYRDAHQTLRGCLFQAVRAARKPNGRVIIQTKPADLEAISIPPEPDLTKVLAILWNIPANEIVPAGTLKLHPHIATNSTPSGHADQAHRIKDILSAYQT